MRFLRAKKKEPERVLTPEEREEKVKELVANGFVFPSSGERATAEVARELAEALVDGDKQRFSSIYMQHELLVWPGQLWGGK